MNIARKRRFAGMSHKMRKEKIKFENREATYRFFPSDMEPRNKFERKKNNASKWFGVAMDDSARLRIGRQNFIRISFFFLFFFFRIKSSKWDSLPAHVLMKSEHIPPYRCIPLQVSVHIIITHSTPFKFKFKFKFNLFGFISSHFSIRIDKMIMLNQRCGCHKKRRA